MNSKKITGLAFLPLLFTASQATHATLVFTPTQCPAGTTATYLGTGSISGTTFIPGTGSPVYQCNVENSAAEVATEVTTQTEKQNNNIIFNHLANNIVNAYKAEKSAQLTQAKTNPLAASADSSNYKPDSVWGETNISSLTEHNSRVPGFATNIYQFLGGLDKRQGDLFYGAALSYAYTDNNLANTNNVMHTVGITPYMAYKINDYLFASGLASYYYSNTSGSAGVRNTDTHDYSGEANINTFKVINAFTLKGRAGVRYKHTNSSQQGAIGTDSTFDEITGVVDAQVDYKFESGLTLFTGALYNHYAREASRVSTLVKGNDVVWMRYGAEYPITKSFLIGAKIENDLNDKLTNYLTGSVNFRLEL